jgi:hypothetical protein
MQIAACPPVVPFRDSRMCARWIVVAPLMALVASVASPLGAQTSAPAAPPAAQFPSPMRETTRAHERLSEHAPSGTVGTFMGPADKPVVVLVPDAAGRDSADVLIHFHGAAWVPQQATAAVAPDRIVATLNLGAGSGAYDRAFSDPATFDALLDSIARVVTVARGHPTSLRQVALSGFSAGHGSIRAILRTPRHVARVQALLLLDGMHTSYVPERQALADGGTLDPTNLQAFADFARRAARGEKRFMITHSEIFPGTYASTTETADWLLEALTLERSPVLRWGPRGMQQLSDVREGGLRLLGFAGNSAPDHVDHLHGMPEFLAELLRP